jgi:DNA-binding NarL/FixJ family response regulator
MTARPIHAISSQEGQRKIRVLAVDDHLLLRDGITALIGDEEDMEVAAEASNGREAIELFRTHRPDVVLMDLQLPDMTGLDALVAIRRESPDACIIVLTTYAGDVQTTRAMRAGARAYLLKNVLHKELLDAIRSVHAGHKRMSPEVAADVAYHSLDDVLTPIEVEVLRLISLGCSNKDIAARLAVTEHSVKSRVKSILAKLDANDRTHAAMIGLKRGIIHLP